MCPGEKNTSFNFLLQIAYSKLKQSLKYGGLLANRQIHVVFGTNIYCCGTALGSQPVFVGDHRSTLLGTLTAYFMFTRIAVGLIWVPLLLIPEDLSWFLKVNSYLPTSLWTYLFFFFQQSRLTIEVFTWGHLCWSLTCELSWYAFHTGLLGRQVLTSVIWSETSINSFYLLSWCHSKFFVICTIQLGRFAAPPKPCFILSSTFWYTLIFWS